MKFKLVQRVNPQDVDAPKKWYANPVNAGTIDQKAIAKEIAGRSSLTTGDVANVIENFLDLLPEHLMEGKTVKLGDFGSFRISFSSEGAATEKEFSTSTIKPIRTLFTPSSDFKKALSSIHFQKQ